MKRVQFNMYFVSLFLIKCDSVICARSTLNVYLRLFTLLIHIFMKCLLLDYSLSVCHNQGSIQIKPFIIYKLFIIYTSRKPLVHGQPFFLLITFGSPRH